jgi:hypothetical protein
MSNCRSNIPRKDYLSGDSGITKKKVDYSETIIYDEISNTTHATLLRFHHNNRLLDTNMNEGRPSSWVDSLAAQLLNSVIQCVSNVVRI